MDVQLSHRSTRRGGNRVSYLVVSLLLVAGSAALAPPVEAREGAKTKPKASAVSRRKLEKDRKETGPRFDEPAEAQRFFLLKRSPDGVSPISAQRYLEARERTRTMPVHSTVDDALLPAGGTSLSALNTALGTWQWLGPGNIGGRCRAILIDPSSPSTMYAAGVAGGVWKSTDAGATWQPLADLMANIAVASLAMTPGQPQTIYAGTGEGFYNADAVRGAGIFKTTDGGSTWTQLAATATADFYYVSKIVVSTLAPLRVYAATRTGVFRSIDGGTTWTKVLAAATQNGFTDMVIRTDKTTDSLFASEGNFSAAVVYRNIDAAGAGTWDQVLGGDASMGRTSLALAPSNQDVVYALSANRTTGNLQYGLYKVLRSTTGGGSGTWSAMWTQTNDATKVPNLLLTNALYANLLPCGQGTSNGFYNQGWYDNVIAVDPTDSNVVWVGGIDLFRSVDGGVTWGLASYWWKASSAYAHADNHAIVFHPGYNGSTNQTVYVGNDGGLFRTDNAKAGTVSSDVCGTTVGSIAWTALNHNLGVTQFYNGVPYPDGLTFFGGTQDNGTVRGTTAAGANTWTMINGGDGGFVAVDPTNTNVLYSETPGLSLEKSTNGGTAWNPATTGITENPNDFLFVTPYAMDPSNAQTLWIGGRMPWRTTDGASSWTQAGTALPGSGSISAIAIAPTDSNTVLLGTSDGWIARTSSGLTATSATTWASVQPATGYCSSLTFDPANKSVAYATYSTFGQRHVWKSLDGGATWAAIDNSPTSPIPDIPAESIAVDPTRSQRLYVGTDLGVFVSTDSGGSWAVENTGFANVVTETLVTRGGYLYAFTHGRGAYRTSLAGSCGVTPTATVSGGGTICAGGSAGISAALTGTAPWTVTWSDGVVQSGVAASPAQRTVSPASTTTYTVTQVTTESGACSAAGTGSATVTVNPGPCSGTVTVSLLGAGVGSVASSPAGISCGATCSASFSSGASVTLTATAGSGSRFAGWAGGGCAGTGPCSVVVAGSTTVSATFLSATPSVFYAITPCRAVDTRNAAGSLGGPALAAGAARAFPLGGTCTVPADAAALSMNVTVADASAPGTLTMYPGAGPAPATNTMNFVVGKNRANNVTMGLIGGTLSVVDLQSTGTVNLIVDVNGFYR